MKIASLFFCLFLAACASTPLADLYAGQVVLTKLESSAYKYAMLSFCGHEKPGELCKTKDAEKTILKAIVTAEDALTVAKANVTPGSVASFQLALNVLTALIPVGVQAVDGE